MLKKYLPQIIILSIILMLYGFFLTEKIDLTTADLGRHIKNGEIILTNFNYHVFKTNFYSFNYPDFSFVNHHWGSGVIFFTIWKIFGFTGLSLFYLTISLFTLALFFCLAKKMSNTTIAFLVSLLLIPLIADREEIRPEVFSYLFAAIFFKILWNWRKTNHTRSLIILPFIEMLWINMHIYFFLGLFITGVFALEKLILFLKQKNEKKNLKIIFFVFVSCLTSSFINPAGWKNVIHPLKIYENYGYQVLEEQSLFFLEKLNIQNPNFLLFKIVFLLLVFSFVFSYLIAKKYSLLNFFLAVGFSSTALWAIRNFSMFAFFVLPIIAYNIKIISEKIKIKNQTADALLVFLILIIFVFHVANNYQQSTAKNFGIGLASQNNASAEFFLKEKIQGPIFNNYDIGSYLIFYLFPQEKVFVDNRPEAYPVTFFEEIYIPMQENNVVWDEQNKKHDFNVIFFAYHDATPWAQNFLITRVNDPKWAPVFVDNYAIIFLKRNDLNKELIEKYEIPKSIFSVTRAQ